MRSTVSVAALLAFTAVAEAASSRRHAIASDGQIGRSPDFYVATTGSDSNDCRTPISACATLGGAQTKLRALLPGPGQFRPWLVQVGGGTYQLTQPLVFTAADSGGSEQNRVTWRAAPGEVPVISGGREITGWTNNAGIWEVTVPEIQSGQYNPRNFWVNDERRLRPRNPGFASYLTPVAYSTVGGAPANQVNQMTYSGTDVNSAMANPLDADAWVPMSWVGEHFMVAGIDGVGKTVTFTGWSGSSKSVNQPTKRYFLENVSELLSSQQGTWYANRTPAGATFDGRLQYNPKVGETINTMRMVIPVLDQLLLVSNTDDGTNVVQHLTFEGLTFAHTDRRPAEYNSYLGDGSGITNPAAINIAGATDIVFDRDTVRNTGGAGVQIGAGCNSCKVVNSIIGDTGSAGIMATTWVAGSTNTAIPYFPHNLIPNPKFAGGGAAATGPGWTGVGTANGLTISIVGTGQENGVPYVDMRVNGTNTTGTTQDRVIRSTSMPISNGDYLDFQGYIIESAGAMTGINYASIGGTLRDSGDAFLSNTISDTMMQKVPGNIQASNLPGSPVGAFAYQINNASAAKVSAYLKVQVQASATVDVTIRFGGLRISKRTDWRRAIASATGPQTIQNTVISNNLIQGVGRVDASAGCIVVTHSRGAVIDHNYCSDTYRMGIEAGLVVGGGSYSAGTGVYTPDPNPIADNLQISRNYIASIGQGVLADFGGVYFAHNTPGTKIFQNVIYNVRGYTSPDACFYADEDASNFSLFNNTCVNIGGTFFFHHKGINADVHDNIAYNVQTDTINSAMQMRGAAYSTKVSDLSGYTTLATGDSFYRNIVTYTEQSCPNLPRLYGDKYDVLSSSGHTFANNLYNITSSCTNRPGTANWIPLDYQTNPAETWTSWTTTHGFDTGTTFQNPNFTGTAPFLVPTVTPSGWVSWNQNDVGLTDPARALGFTTPVAIYP